MEEKLTLETKWDKVFPLSEKVNHKKVTFHNRYGITLAADMYTPKNAKGKLSAIAVCGPFGAVLMIHGDKAHSCYFSKDAYKKLKGDNKELLLISGAVHTDLYDRIDIIPFDKIESFYRTYLK